MTTSEWGSVTPGDSVVIMTSMLWFPGGVEQLVEVLEVMGGFARVRGTKKFLGVLWTVRKEFIVGAYSVHAIRSRELSELERMGKL